MELRSRRRLRTSPPPSDHISALPDDSLLQILSRLRCVRAAAQTSLLSHRWSRVWEGLLAGATDNLIFRGAAPGKVEELLRWYASRQRQVSTLDISLPREACQYHAIRGTNSLLRFAVWRSPVQLLLTVWADIELPCFQHTTSIELHMESFCVKPLPAGEFTALQSLSLTGRIEDLGSLLSRCPRLRVLSVTHPDMYGFRLTPPACELPMLEELSLYGKIVGLASLLNCCPGLRVLSITQREKICNLPILEKIFLGIPLPGDSHTPLFLRIPLPPSGEFPMLEKLSLAGNIADLGTLLNGCPRLRELGLTFRGTAPGSLKATLEEVAPLGLVVSILDIEAGCTEFPWTVDAALLSSLLRTAATLSPREVLFSDEGCYYKQINAHLPCFAHATSIEIRFSDVCFTPLPDGEFSMLERLTISYRYSGIANIGALVTHCPRLRVLEVAVATGKIKVHSTTLQELYVLPMTGPGYTQYHGIDIVTPLLKKLRMTITAAGDIGVSISAPAIEKLSWHRSHWAVVFGSWLLETMSVDTIEKSNPENSDDTCWQVQQQLSHFHVLRLQLNAGNHLGTELNIAQEIEKLPVTNFSVLELNIISDSHVYGALVLQLLRMRQIRAAMKKLKVVLPWWSEEKQACQINCPCDKPKNWRSRSVFTICLEEVEIHGFMGEAHENDFLTLIFRCSPLLKKVTVRLAKTFGGCTTIMSNLFMAHPSVNCYGYFSSGELVPHASC